MVKKFLFSFFAFLFCSTIAFAQVELDSNTDNYIDAAYLISGGPADNSIVRFSEDGAVDKLQSSSVTISDGGTVNIPAGQTYNIDGSAHAHTGVYQPVDTDLTALAAISGVQGDIIYHNGTSWVRLAAGTADYYLQTKGAGANPIWAEVVAGGGGTGDVSGVGNCADGPCLDGSSDGGTYIRLYDGNSHYTQIAVGDSTANLTFTFPTAYPVGENAIVVSSSAGVLSTVASTTYQPLDADLTALAAISGVQGDVIYHNGTSWVRLGAGISGQYLQTQGAGANVQWASTSVSGDIEAVGDVTSGSAFTGAGGGNTLYFEGATANDFEIALTGADPTSDVTVTIPAETGTIVIGPAGFGTTERLIKTNGVGNLTQITGITVDGSNNVSGVGTLGLTSASPTSFVAVGSDPADAGAIRLENAAAILFEAAPAGTDVNALTVTSGEIIQIGAAGASGVTITPALTASAGLTVTTGQAITVGTTQWSSSDEIDGTKIKDADYGDVTVSAAGAWAVEDDSHAHGSTTITLASTNLSDATSIAMLADDESVTGSWSFGNADTDTLTIRSIIRGGNSRAVWIDDDTTVAPTYATATNELYVEGDVEVGGTLYAAAVSTGTGTDGQRRIDFTSNTTFTPSGNQMYFLNNVAKVSENGTERDIVTPADSVTWTGTSHSFVGVTNLLLPTATPDANGEIAINNTNETFLMYINSGLKSFDFTGDSSGYVLKSDGSGNFTLQVDATGGSPTLNSVANPTGDTTIAMDATEEVNFQYTGNYTTGSQFLVQQVTGNPSGGVLFEVRAADADTVLARLGDGTNYLQISQAGNVSHAGTSVFTAPRVATSIAPSTADGATLGTTALEFSDLYLADGGVIYFQNDQSVYLTPSAGTLTLTGAFVSSGAHTPSAAGGAALGSATAEWDHLYLHDSAIIYGQADQSATLTSSASLWTANNFSVTTQFKLPSSDADPTATAGYLRHDSTITNFTNGGLVYYNGAAIKQLVDMTTATAQACTDTQVVAYNASTDLWYCKDDANTGGTPTVITVADTTDATSYVALFESATGDLGPKTDAGATYNASTGLLSTTLLSTGTLTTSGDIELGAASDTTLARVSAGVVSIEGSNITTAASSPALTGSWDFGGATGLEIPNGTNPTVDATGEIALDTDGANESSDMTLRAFDGTNTVAMGRKLHCIQVTVVKPQDIADSVRDRFPVWNNNTGMTFTITEIKAWSDTDNTTLNVEVVTATNWGSPALVDAIECATDGTGVYTDTQTTISDSTIAHDETITLDFDDTDDPGVVQVIICGWFNAAVD